MKISYYPLGSWAMSSSRLRVHMVAQELIRLGHTVDYNTFADDTDVILIQKRFDCGSVINAAREKKIPLIWDVDDYIPGGPAHLVNVVTTDRPEKRKLYPDAIVIPDCLDLSDLIYSSIKTSHRPNLGLIGTYCNAENAVHIRDVNTARKSLDLEFQVITDLRLVALPSDVQGIQWTLESVNSQIIQWDLVVLPLTRDSKWSDLWVGSKSSNRLLKAWGLAMPVVGAPIAAYQEMGLAYTASSVKEWVEALTALRDVSARVRTGREGYLKAQEFKASVLVQEWLKLFRRLTLHE